MQITEKLLIIMIYLAFISIEVTGMIFKGNLNGITEIKRPEDSAKESIENFVNTQANLTSFSMEVTPNIPIPNECNSPT